MPIAMTADPQVVAAYVGIGASALLGVVALVVALKGLGVQKATAEAARVSAEAAQRANYLAEQRMVREANAHLPPPLRDVADAINAAHQRPDVRWVLDRKGKSSFVLRNVGSDTAEGVRVVEGGQPLGVTTRNLPESATLRPNESTEFLIIGALGAPVPNEIYVASRGYEDEPQVVPVPS